MKLIPTLLCDWYKQSHRIQYPDKTEVVYSTWIPRSGNHMPEVTKVVCFGIQGFLKELNEQFEPFFKAAKEEVVAEFSRYLKYCLFIENPDTTHIEELHDLGYLPLKFKALEEGTLVPFRVPMLTVENTDPRFFWLTNYIETYASAVLWKPCTTASIALVYRQILDEYAFKTTGSIEGVQFQGHDFSMRGMSGVEDAARSGAGHLLSFVGSDTIPATMYLEEYYGADIEKELVACSVSATEHSVMSAGGAGDEYETYRRIIEDLYPDGIISIVSDTWDLWKVLTDIIPKLKPSILKRWEGKEGLHKVVCRPDSGDPVDIICGEDITEYKSLDDARSVVHEIICEKAAEACEGSLCVGDTKYAKVVKVDGKYYRITVEIEYNRHDKTYSGNSRGFYKLYYYVDESRIIGCEEITPTPAQLGVIEILWNIFGGSVTEQGYKVLHPAIGAIYGDSITIDRCRNICKRLEKKGFASTNLVYGIGSYTYQFITRDSLGFALKSTSVTIDGEVLPIFKDPVTDDGVKKSAKGRVVVLKEKSGNLYYLDDNNSITAEDYENDLLKVVYENGLLTREVTLQEIRDSIPRLA